MSSINGSICGLHGLPYDPTIYLELLGTELKERFMQRFPKDQYSQEDWHRLLVCGGPLLHPSYDEKDLREHFAWDGPAFWRYKDIYFLAKDKRRMVIREDLQWWYNRKYRMWKVPGRSDRVHARWPSNLSFSNRKTGYSYHQPHPSEPGWNVPKEHPRHFLKFPREIRDMMLEHLLVAPAPINPKTLEITWYREWQPPSYNLQGGGSALDWKLQADGLVESYVYIDLRDKDGPYTEIRRVLTRPIDATCLRVNKQFNIEGSRILYGQNTFDFERATFHPVIRTLDAMHKERAHLSCSLRYADVGRKSFMQMVQRFYKTWPSAEELPEWLYCDPILRFLHTIGPYSAALVRNVKLPGTISNHLLYGGLSCPMDCAQAHDCIGYNLHFYGHFFARWCPDLRRVSFQAACLVSEKGSTESNGWGDEDEEIIRASPKEMAQWKETLPFLMTYRLKHFPALREVQFEDLYSGLQPTVEAVNRTILARNYLSKR